MIQVYTKILKYSSTGWLTRQEFIERILEKWQPLPYYFTLNDFEAELKNFKLKFVILIYFFKFRYQTTLYVFEICFKNTKIKKFRNVSRGRSNSYNFRTNKPSNESQF